MGLVAFVVAAIVTAGVFTSPIAYGYDGAGPTTVVLRDDSAKAVPELDLLRAPPAAAGPLSAYDHRVDTARVLVRSGLAGSAPQTAAHNAADFARLTNQLQFDEAASVFTKSGGLQPSVIQDARLITPGARIGNPEVIKALTADGSNIEEGWVSRRLDSLDTSLVIPVGRRPIR